MPALPCSIATGAKVLDLIQKGNLQSACVHAPKYMYQVGYSASLLLLSEIAANAAKMEIDRAQQSRFTCKLPSSNFVEDS